MTKWDSRQQEKEVSASVLKTVPLDKLLKAKEFITTFLKYKQLSTLNKNYVNGVRKAIEYNQEDKIYVDFKFEGTRTGRLSCGGYKAGKSKPKGVSFHTLAKEDDYNVRDIFIAPKGYAFVTLDYSTMELRVLSHVAGETKMAEAFYDKKDLHNRTTAYIFGMNEDEVKKKSPERDVGKTISFLVVYGGGATNLSETANISLDKAQKFIDLYFSLFKDLKKYLNTVRHKIETQKYIDTIFGRRRHLPDIDSKNKKVKEKAIRQGLNFTVQSPASDVLLCCLLSMQRKFNELFLGAKILACVHDSIELIVPFENIIPTLEIAYDQMVNYPIIRKVFNLSFNVPLEVEAEVGFSFGGGKTVKYSDTGKVLNEVEIFKYLVENKNAL